MDSETVISAYSMKNGKKIWTSEITPKTEESDYINGGLAYKSNRIYVTTGFGQVVSLAANSGKVLWRQHIGIPMHTAPTAKDNRVFAITVTNKLYALNSETGAILWTHAGIEETTSILGGGSPGVDSGVVIAPYSSGDFFALKVENGQELWSHSLAGGERNQGTSSLSAIRGRPIIDRGIVFVISNSGRSVAVNLRTGQRIWEREIGGIESPWVAGDYLFILSSGAKLSALSRLTGQIYWITDLPRWKKPNKQESKITWAGPVLASDRLILAGSAGHVLSVSPYSGKILGRVKIAAGGTISPVIAQDSLLLLSNNAKLEIYR
jgi:outer membrane protein assembly factor BamB